MARCLLFFSHLSHFAYYIAYFFIYQLDYYFEEMISTLMADSLETSHEISVRVDSPNEINSIFDIISYSKGGAINTEKTFKKGVSVRFDSF